jgi:CHAD domain-containing protein
MLKITKQFVIFLTLLLFISKLYAEDGKILEAVESSSRAWLSLPDSRKYAESWKNASALFQAKKSESGWIKNMEAIRSPLGAMKSRHIATAHLATSLPNMPDGEYVVVQFYTSFEHKALALETVTTVKEKSDTWRVSEYLIK